MYVIVYTLTPGIPTTCPTDDSGIAICHTYMYMCVAILGTNVLFHVCLSNECDFEEVIFCL